MAGSITFRSSLSLKARANDHADNGRSALMRARRIIAANEVGRPGPPIYLRGHSRRRRRGGLRVVLGVLVLAILVILCLAGLQTASTTP